MIPWGSGSCTVRAEKSLGESIQPPVMSSTSKKLRVSRGPRTKKPLEPEEEDTCVICANPYQFVAVTPCNHRVCHRCLLRQRVLYDKKACLLCRSDNETVVISQAEFAQDFDSYSTKDFVKYDAKRHKQWAIEFTDDRLLLETERLLSYLCSLCEESFDQFRPLQDHVRLAHAKFYCLICCKHKKAFVDELPVFTHKQLVRHQTEGDDNGFSGHPECKHCHTRFYSEDELNVHIRDRHERCHICDQTTPKTADYYKNYESLYKHFKRDHFVCTVPQCVEKGFVVFADDLELAAHMVKEHGHITGSNKMVIGLSFHSQLLTFPNLAQRRHFESNTSNEDHNDPEVKKKRFEERARHYLNYNKLLIDQFQRLNANFRNGKITARNLYDSYCELFAKQTPAEIALLMGEFAGIIGGQRQLKDQLDAIVKEINSQTELTTQFPVLQKLGSLTPVILQAWVNKGSLPGGLRQEKFPALAKPARKPAPVQQPTIKYKTVLLQPQPKAKVQVNTRQANYTPAYLSSRSALASPLTGSLRASPNADKFPALEKKPKKTVIPRVNQYLIPDPNQWGTPSPKPKSNGSPADEFGGIGIKVVDKRKGKKKGPHNTSDLF